MARNLRKKMKTIEKVILISHPLREFNNYGSAWPSSMLKFYLDKTTNLPSFRLVPPNFITAGFEDDLIYFDYVKFLKFYGLDYARDKWGSLFYSKEYNKQAYDYIYNIFKSSIVIGHEIEYCILEILDYFNIPYIDIYNSPIRFMDDQMFCMTTNFESIYNKLLEYKLPDIQIELQANYLKSFYLMRDAEKIQKKDSVLFIGQTKYDRSLIVPETGEIYEILNHKEEFQNAIKGYNNILYKRHPKVIEDGEIIKYLESLGNIEITNENFYSLISRPDIKKIVAISSGGLNEAKYFGKETKYLLHSSVNLQYGNNFDKEKYINIYEHFFSLHFWADILSPIIKTIDYPKEIGYYGQKNKLRNSRGHRDYWGYQDFDHESIKEDILSVNIQKEFKKKSKIIRLLYHLTFNKNFLFLHEKLNK